MMQSSQAEPQRSQNHAFLALSFLQLPHIQPALLGFRLDIAMLMRRRSLGSLLWCDAKVLCMEANWATDNVLIPRRWRCHRKRAAACFLLSALLAEGKMMTKFRKLKFRCSQVNKLEAQEPNEEREDPEAPAHTQRSGTIPWRGAVPTQCKPDRNVKVPQEMQNPIYGSELVTRPRALCLGKNQSKISGKGIPGNDDVSCRR